MTEREADLLDARVRLREVFRVMTIVISMIITVGGGVWYLSSNIDHRVSQLEAKLDVGFPLRDAQIAALQMAAEELKRADQQQNQEMGPLRAMLLEYATFHKRVDSVICHVMPVQCVREP